MVDRDAEFMSGGDVSTCTKVTPISLRRDLEHLDEVETLVVGVVVIVELLRSQQTEVLVTPGEVADRRGDPVQVVLKLTVLGIIREIGEFPETFNALDQLVSVLAGDVDCFRNRQFLHIVGRAGHPRAGLLAPKDTELEGAAPGNAAEAGWEFVVVLELEPVDKAVLIAVGVHRFKEFLAIELHQLGGSEPGAKGLGSTLPVAPRIGVYRRR